ncbi:MAG TPA: sigma factor [Vicinamibacterales bacterium]
MIDFSELYKAHAHEVHRFVLFLSGDRALADDVVSETFIRLWHARSRVDLGTVKAYLLTIYLAGEASTDTQALVEEYLKTDPALARDVEAARGASLGLPATATPSAEKEALEDTRQVLKNRTATLVVAMIFTVLPFAFVVHGTTLTFLLVRDAPVIGIAWWATAAVMWFWHGRIRRRLRVSGL